MMNHDLASPSFQNVVRKFSKSMDMRDLNRDFDWIKKIAGEQKRLSNITRGNAHPRKCCPICESKHSTSVVNVFGFDYSECGQCRHIYLEDLPSKEAIQSLYTSNGDSQAVQGQIYLDEDLFNKRLRKIAEPKVKAIADFAVSSKTWLDIGCGTGENLFAARNLGYKVSGIEADRAEVRFASSKNIEVTNEFVGEDFNRPELLGNVDIVTSFNVLEHIENPVPWVNNLASQMRSGALLFFEVPRTPSLSNLTRQLFPDLAYRHIYPPDHLHIFSERAMEIIFDKAGCSVQFVWNFGQDVFELLSAAACQTGLKDRKIFDQVMNISGALQAAVDQNSMSDIMIIGARKI